MRTITLSKYFAILAAFFLLTASLYAATVNGTWNATVDLGGQGGSPKLVFQQDGDKLTGTYSGALGESPLHGTVKGSEISFDFEIQGGTIHYEGTIDAAGTKITGTCTYGTLGKGTFTATKDDAKTAK